jgi:hypothetical protein
VYLFFTAVEALFTFKDYCLKMSMIKADLKSGERESEREKVRDREKERKKI